MLEKKNSFQDRTPAKQKSTLISMLAIKTRSLTSKAHAKSYCRLYINRIILKDLVFNVSVSVSDYFPL